MSRKRPRDALQHVNVSFAFPLDVLNNIARFLPLYDALKLRMLCRATAGCPGTLAAVALTPALKWTWRLSRKQSFALRRAVKRGDVRLRAALGPGTSIHTLKLWHDRFFVYGRVTHASAYGNVHTLDLAWTNVKDVSALGNVHTLSLRGTLVTDVSQLGNVHSLDLAFTGVEVVSALGNVHTLDLRETDVTDITALHNVSVLMIDDDK